MARWVPVSKRLPTLLSDRRRLRPNGFTLGSCENLNAHKCADCLGKAGAPTGAGRDIYSAGAGLSEARRTKAARSPLNGEHASIVSLLAVMRAEERWALFLSMSWGYLLQRRLLADHPAAAISRHKDVLFLIRFSANDHD
jgi:hypothetical protein